MIRRASPADADRIAEIWLERPKPREDDPLDAQMIRDAVARLELPFGYWVFEVDGLVFGWASLSPMRANPAVSPSMAEYSCYIAQCGRAGGVGNELIYQVSCEAEESSLEYLVCFIASNNLSARNMVERNAFERAAEFSAPAKNLKRGDVLLYRRGV